MISFNRRFSGISWFSFALNFFCSCSSSLSVISSFFLSIMYFERFTIFLPNWKNHIARLKAPSIINVHAKRNKMFAFQLASSMLVSLVSSKEENPSRTCSPFPAPSKLRPLLLLHLILHVSPDASPLSSTFGLPHSPQTHSHQFSHPHDLPFFITYLRPVRRAFERLFVPTSAGFSSVGMVVMLSFFSLTFCCNHKRLAAMWRVLPMPRRLARACAAEESDLQISLHSSPQRNCSSVSEQTFWNSSCHANILWFTKAQSNALMTAHIGFNEISIQINLGGWNQSFCSHDFQRSLHRKSFPWDDGHQRHLHV